MKWYNKKKTIKEARGLGGTPLINDPHKGYKKSKPGDQNGGDGVTYQLSPRLYGLWIRRYRHKRPKRR